MTQLPEVKRSYLESRRPAIRTRAEQVTLNSLGRALRNARCEQNLKSTALAEQVGCSIQAISNIENGVSWPSLPMYFKICAALKLGKPPLL